MDHQLCLSWSQHQSTLIGVFENLLGNESLSDCTLAAEGKYLKAHKLVLSAFSPYFATLLKEQYDKHPIFMLKDIKYQQLHAIMLYMYRGEVHIPQSQLADLLKAAESLQIKGLQQEDHQKEYSPTKRKDISGSEEGMSLRPRKVSRLSKNDISKRSTSIENIELPNQDTLNYSIDSKPEFDEFENTWTMSEPMTIQQDEDQEDEENQSEFADVDPFMDIPENSTALVEEIKKLRKDIKDLKKIVTANNPKILEGVSKIPNILVEVSKLGEAPITKSRFPIASFDALDNFEAEMESSPSKYIPIFKALLLPGGISKNLKRVVSDKLLFQMNYAGIKDRKGFAVYTHLLNALFEAVKEDHYTWNDFKKDCRKSIYRIKNKVYKNNHFARKKIQSEFTDTETY